MSKRFREWCCGIPRADNLPHPGVKIVGQDTPVGGDQELVSSRIVAGTGDRQPGGACQRTIQRGRNDPDDGAGRAIQRGDLAIARREGLADVDATIPGINRQSLRKAQTAQVSSWSAGRRWHRA